MKKVINAVAIAALLCAVAYAQEVKKEKTLAEWKAVATDAAKPDDERLKAESKWRKLAKKDESVDYLALARERMENAKTMTSHRAKVLQLDLGYAIGYRLGRAGKRAESLAQYESIVPGYETITYQNARAATSPILAAGTCVICGKQWKEPKLVALAARLYKAPPFVSPRNNISKWYLRAVNSASPFTAAEQLEILNVWKPMFLAQVENYGLDVGKIRILKIMERKGVITKDEFKSTLQNYADFLVENLDGKDADKAKAAFNVVRRRLKAMKIVEELKQ